MKYRLHLLASIAALSASTMASAVSIEAQKIPNKPSMVVEGFDTQPTWQVEALRSTGLLKELSGTCAEATVELRTEILCIKRNEAGEVKATIGEQTLPEDFENYVYSLITQQDSVPYKDPIAFIARDKKGTYSLYSADFNGSNQKLIHRAEQPILSPSWSPSGNYISYVSFEGYRSAIFVQSLQTGQRWRVISQRGLNAYPSFEDDNTLLVSLSNERVNSDIYRFDLLTKKKERITKTRRPEVYPKKTPDGIIFVQMHGDIPYIFSVSDEGKVTQEHRTPQSTVDHSPTNDCRISSYGKTINIAAGDTNNELTLSGGVESATIQSECEFSYAITEDAIGAHIVTINRFGEVVSKIRAMNQEIIQVSAH